MKKLLAISALSIVIAHSQTSEESEMVLPKARQNVAAISQRLVRYTCVQTIDREYFAMATAPVRGKVMTTSKASCSDAIDQPRNDLVTMSTDRLRLEVAVAGNREIVSWPQASRFESRTIDQVVNSGPTSTGSFGTYLIEIFENPGAEIVFAGEQRQSDRRVFAYRFDIPRESSHYRIRVAGEWQYTATSGSFDVDAATGDLTNLVIKTAPAPSGAEMCQARTAIDYRELRIGDGNLLIPLRSELQTDQVDSTRTKSLTAFSACHEYSAESSIRFDDETPDAVSPADKQIAVPSLPAGLSLSLKLTSAIDTRTAAAGDTVFATVSKAVTTAPNGILIPSGARVKGRISQMQRFIGSSPRFQIGLTFDSVELKGIDTPVVMALAAESRPLADAVGGSRGRTYGRSSGFPVRPLDLQIPPPNARDSGGTFIFATDKAYWIVPAGYESKWITRVRRP